MNVGIFLGDNITPQKGGAFSLLEVIKRGMHKANCAWFDTPQAATHQPWYRFFIVYHGGADEPYKAERDGIVFINLNAIEQKPLFHIPGGSFSAPHNRARINIAAARENIEVFYIAYPYYFDGLEYPYIFTVWDLGHRMLPAFPEVSRCEADEWDGREKTYRTMFYKATYIVTGNEAGKQEILQNYCVPPGKIRISPFPVSSFCGEEEEKPPFDLPPDGEYFFYPAQFWPHKNHTAILDALVLLREKHGLSPHVYFTGSDHGNMEYVKSEALRLGLQEQVHFAGFVSNGVLKYLYTHAASMIFASLMGPNNIPPIEAASLGCPVIITDIAGHKEQMQDAAVYFDGYRPETLAEAMHTMLTDKTARDALIEKEHRLAAEFNNVDYFGRMVELLDEFSLMRRTWNNDYRERAAQFSVIIPVHNGEKTLHRCIQSVLEQTYPHFELILVDDNSTDGSLDILREYAAKDERVVVAEQEKGKDGLQAARNAGIRAARYEWLMFGNSSDKWLPNKIQRENEELRAEGYDDRCVIYSDCERVDLRTGEQSYLALPHIRIDNSFKDLIKTTGAALQGLVCSSRLMNKAGLLDEKVPSCQEQCIEFIEMRDASLMLARQGYFVHIKEALFIRYVEGDDRTRRAKRQAKIGRKYIEKKYQKDFLRVCGNRKKQALKKVIKSIVYFPFKTIRKISQVLQKEEE